MQRRHLFGLSILALSPIGACISSSPTGAPDFDAGPFSFDGGNPGFDVVIATDAGSGADGSVLDATLPDAGSPDAGEGDSGSGGDAAVSDASAADVTVADVATTNTPDASETGGLDATSVAVTDASDASTADVYDSGLWCIASILGDYYARTDGSLVYSPNQTVVTGLPAGTSVQNVAQQVDHACALVSDGTVWCWPTTDGGGNTYGDLGNGQIGGTTTKFAATQVVTQPSDAGPPSFLTGVSALEGPSITIYSHATCAIRSDQSVWCWGNSGAQGSPPAGIFWGTTASEASVPYAVEMALDATDAGGAYPPILADSVTVGADHICYLRGGAVSCFGENISGNLANGDTTLSFQPYPLPVVPANGLPANITSIGSGYRFTCALAQGMVWCWGSDSAYEIGNPSAPTSFCNLNYCLPAPTPVQVGLPDGGVNVSPDGGIDVFPLSGVSELVTGYLGACALVSGQLYCWGANTTKAATPYASTFVPYTGITSFSMSGAQEDFPAGLRYLTPSGIVQGSQLVQPVCQ